MAMTPMEGFTFGCDPEGVIVDAAGQAVSPVGIIPGTKDKPHPVGPGWVHPDGMAAEFGIRPVKTYQEWNTSIAVMLHELNNFLPQGHSIIWVPSIKFPKEVFDAAPDSAKELGCDPDYDAWTGDVNPPPEPTDPLVRCFGGHIHVGWGEGFDLSDGQHVMNCQDLIKQFDWFLAAWALRMDRDRVRRTLYGKAGAYRPKPYGVEYRTLSNFWVTSAERRRNVWNRMVYAIAAMKNRYIPEERSAQNARLIELINTSTHSTNFDRDNSFPINSIGTYEGAEA